MRFRRILGAWAVLMIVLTFNAAFRLVVLHRFFDADLADLLSSLMGMGLVFLGSWPFLSDLEPMPTGTLIRISGWWVLLTVLMESMFGHYGTGRPWSDVRRDYELWNGSFWPLVLFAMLIAPFVWMRRSDRLPKARRVTQ